MTYNKGRKRRVNRRILFFILAIVFTCSTVVLASKLPGQLKTLETVKISASEAKKMKVDYEQKIADNQKSIESLQSNIETLKADLKKAQDENPQLYKLAQNKEVRHAYLTFDDGPSENTGKILDFLAANHIKATFFVVGTEGKEALYKRIVDEGHTLAIHSNTHKYSEIYTSVYAFMQDINTLSDKLYKITGQRPTILRFPGGSNNTISVKYSGEDIMGKLVAKVKEQGYTYFDWNVDSSDAEAKCQSKDIIVSSVLNGASDKKNAIILMHDAAIKKTTVEALPEIVAGLRKEGYVFARITEDTVSVQFKK